MDKKSFINALQDYSRVTVEEALELLSLKQQFPYCQILHALSAKVSQDHEFSTSQQELQLAAIYASDRAVLKEVMSGESSVFIKTASVDDTTRKDQENSGITTVTSTTDDSIPKIDIAAEVMNGLSQLHKSKSDFEMMFDDIAEKAIEDRSSKKTIVSKNKDTPHPVEKDKTGKSKKERIIEIARALESAAAPSIEKTPSPKRKRETSGDGLIDEIASKKEINPETEKQKAQIEIIDQFIKAQPSLVNTKPLPLPSDDLSVIKSGDFGDNIISETLVEILVKQGKNDKAIEVLKKLIWKFPQKKTYFAAQIEELKNRL